MVQIALTWFQDSGWEYCCGPDIAPDGYAHLVCFATVSKLETVRMLSSV